MFVVPTLLESKMFQNRRSQALGPAHYSHLRMFSGNKEHLLQPVFVTDALGKVWSSGDPLASYVLHVASSLSWIPMEIMSY